MRFTDRPILTWSCIGAVQRRRREYAPHLTGFGLSVGRIRQTGLSNGNVYFLIFLKSFGKILSAETRPKTVFIASVMLPWSVMLQGLSSGTDRPILVREYQP